MSFLTASARSVPSMLEISPFKNNFGVIVPVASLRRLWFANPFVSSSFEFAVSFPHRRLFRDISVMVGRAAITGFWESPSSGSISTQASFQIKSAFNSEKTDMFIPSKTMKSSRWFLAMGAIILSRKSSTLMRLSPSEPDAVHFFKLLAKCLFWVSRIDPTCFITLMYAWLSSWHSSHILKASRARST